MFCSQELNAADNKLKTVPKLDGLRSLTLLAIYNNNLVMMPDIKGLEKLQTLKMYRCVETSSIRFSISTFLRYPYLSSPIHHDFFTILYVCIC